MRQLPVEFAEKMTIPLYKIVLAGDFGVGKTSIFQRYERNTFSKYKGATIGVDKMTKDVTVDGGQPCKVSAYTLQDLRSWDSSEIRSEFHSCLEFWLFVLGNLHVYHFPD